ncbi:MAG: SLC13 family permease [Treponema sp.]
MDFSEVFMYSADIMEMKWLVLCAALFMYLLVILFQDKKVVFSSAAAIILLALGIIFPGKIFTAAGSARFSAAVHSLTELINWNVLMIYAGSMAIAALFIYSRVPTRIADSIVARAPSTGIAIILILAMTGIISIFVENVATVLVMAPIALALSKKLSLNPTYFMAGLAVMSNLEGTATLVGDPPSMIFASYAGYTFNDFFAHQGRISIFFFIQTGMIAGCIFFYFYFRNAVEKVSAERTKVISFFPAVLLCMMIAGLAAISFLHLEIEWLSGLFVIILGIIGVFWYAVIEHKGKKEVFALLKELDWESILFLSGIFIVVGAVSETGLLADLAAFLSHVTGGSVLLGFLLIILISVLISGFVDNVPYIIVMLPVADSLAKSMGTKGELFMFALLIGSCLGGNLTPFGASANIVAMGILKRENYPMTFRSWVKIGLPFTLLTTAAASVLLWFVWK